jgi:hypothetical protein
VQGLALILTTQCDKIQRDNPQLFTDICKKLFKKNFSSLSQCSPLVLCDLLRLLESNKHGLNFFKDKVKRVFKN